MTEPSKTSLLANAIINKINSLIGNHNTDSSAHSTLLNDYVKKSQTNGLIKNDGTIDTNTYLTSHQSLSDYATLNSVASDIATHNSNSSAHATEMAKKLDKNQGNANAGKFLKVGNDGNISLETISLSNDIELIEATSSLGTASSSTMNKLYLVPNSSSSANDAYDIYVTVKTGTTDNYTYSWERIDSTNIDLTGYSQTSHTHGNITSDGKIGSASGKLIVTTTNGVLTTSDSVSELETVVQSLITYGESLNSSD